MAIVSYNLSQCRLSTCQFSDRHYRVKHKHGDDIQHRNNNHNEHGEMKYGEIYMETMDSLHYYLFHLTMTGMRQTVAIDQDQQKEKQAIDITAEHFDSSFKLLYDRINQSRRKTNRFTRISGNKFNISVVDSEVKGNDSFLDAVYNEILKTHHENLVFTAKDIIETNGYDTDSLDLDSEIFMTDQKSNLSELMGNGSDTHTLIVTLLQKYKSYVGPSVHRAILCAIVHLHSGCRFIFRRY